jgi:Rieske Fe-S protein
MDDWEVDRRVVVAGAGVLALGAVAACGTYGAPSAPATSGAGGSSGGGSSSGANALAKTSDIPVGGGKVFASQQVVVTQPVASTFKAFSAICTHQGCTVGGVSGGTINCPCHGSKFKIADGAVAKGPAEQPLPPKTVTVRGDSIILG